MNIKTSTLGTLITATLTMFSHAAQAQEQGDIGGTAQTQGQVGAQTGGQAQAGGQGQGTANPELGVGVPGGEQGPNPGPAASPAGGAAVDQAIGKWGIGYFSTSAPVGVRRWVDESMGFDAGVGFNVDTQGQTTWGLALEGGLLFPLMRYDNLLVFGRGGMGIGLDDSGAGADFNLNVNGLLGGEFFMTALGFPNLSFTGAIGVQANFIKRDQGDFGFQLATASAPINLVTSALLGFHIYI